MKICRRVISVLTLFLILPLSLVSCSGDFQVFEKVPSTEEQTNRVETTPIRGEDADNRLENNITFPTPEPDTLPDMNPSDNPVVPPQELPEPDYNYDFAGADFRILSSDSGMIASEWGNGEQSVLSSLAVERNTAVERQLNVAMSMITVDRSDLHDRLQKDILSGTYSYQTVSTQVSQMPYLAAVGCLSDLSEDVFDSYELYQPWWNSNFSRVARVGNVQRYAVGAADLSVYQNAYVTFFNTDVTQALGIEDQLYDLVFQGQWTFSILLELSQLIVSVSDHQVYGAVSSESAVANGFLHAFGFSVIQSNDCGEHTLVRPSDRMADAVEFLRILWGTDAAQMCSDVSSALNLFASEKAVFFVSELYQADTLRDSIPYGILPLPKYDNDQKTYQTGTSVGHSASAVPILGSSGQAHMAGVVLSRLNSLSYESDIPQTVFYYYGNSALDTRILGFLPESVGWDLSEVAMSHLGESPWRAAVRESSLLIKQYDSLKDSYSEKLSHLLDCIRWSAKG